ncbi:MAG: primase [Acidobacteria bacterium]|nr:primase [Acidobacteriota bacterium]
MLYDQFFIDDLKNRADLVRIIEPYAPLKKKGANWMGCCPFHQEKTPSFSVNPAKGFYKCFGCAKGGNVYTFLMEIEGLNFPEAIKRVAEISGVTLPEPIDDANYERNKKRKQEKKQIADQIIELNRFALEFWENHLQDDNPHSKAAREYLESREISIETQKAFHIGFSPDSWDALMSLLKEKGADEKLIEASGLVSINEEKKRVYDRFRGRIMFPVLNIDGNPIAFGARSLGPGEPKYLNSPETPAYIKGEHLYGLFQSRNEIKQKKFVILVEGYLDLIALHQFGIKNTAASLGTAFTPTQAKLLNRFAKKVVVNYDGDSAGVKAARRAIETLLAEDFEIKVLILPDGKDPDDYIRANGAESYNHARGHALPFTQFVLETAVQGRNIALSKHKAEAMDEVLPVICAVREKTQKREFFDSAVLRFKIDNSTLRNDFWKLVKLGIRPEPAEVKKLVLRSLKERLTVAENKLLELLIHDNELREIILPQLEETDFEMLTTASVFRALFEVQDKGLEISLDNLLDLVREDETAGDFVPVLFMSEPLREKGEAIDEVLRQAEDCVFTLRSMAISNRILDISQELILAEQSGDSELVGQLVGEQIELARLKRELQGRVTEY